MAKEVEYETKDMAALNSLVVSAPAKVILHGEHAVVYGKVCMSLLSRKDLECQCFNPFPDGHGLLICYSV